MKPVRTPAEAMPLFKSWKALAYNMARGTARRLDRGGFAWSTCHTMETDDLEQIALTELWRAALNYRDDGPSFGSTAYTYILYRMQHQLRRLRSRRGSRVFVSLNDKLPRGEEWGEVLAAPGRDPDPAEAAAAADEREYLARRVREAVAALPSEKQRLAVRMHLDGFSFREIARHMGNTPSAVCELMRKARLDLAERLGDLADRVLYDR